MEQKKLSGLLCLAFLCCLENDFWHHQQDGAGALTISLCGVDNFMMK